MTLVLLLLMCLIFSDKSCSRQFTPSSRSLAKFNLSSKMVANWELSSGRFNVIKGHPGPDLKMFNGVRVLNGHAELDGHHGYFDAGDYQGECFSDPEVCDHGFTVQMTLKIFNESIYDKGQHFIMDTGATQNNSRGISLWVTHGYLFGLVVTREKTWCLTSLLHPYDEKWISLTLTWRNDIGLHLFINCEIFDQSSDHKDIECEDCTNCHRRDTMTRLMFGRRNKGPHFKVTKMAMGMISLYEKFSNPYEVENICDKEGTAPIREAADLPSMSPDQERRSNCPAISANVKNNNNTSNYSEIDDLSNIVWPTPVTKVTKGPWTPKTTTIKWPKPSPRLAIVTKRKIRPTHPRIFLTKDVRRLLVIPVLKTKDTVPMKKMQLTDEEIPLLQFILGDQKRSQDTSKLETQINTLKHR